MSLRINKNTSKSARAFSFVEDRHQLDSSLNATLQGTVDGGIESLVCAFAGEENPRNLDERERGSSVNDSLNKGIEEEKVRHVNLSTTPSGKFSNTPHCSGSSEDPRSYPIWCVSHAKTFAILCRGVNGVVSVRSSGKPVLMPFTPEDEERTPADEQIRVMLL